MPGPFEVTGGFLKGKLCAVDFRHTLGAFNLQVFVIQPAKQFALSNLIAYIDWKLGDAPVYFRSNRNLVCRADVPSSIDNKADIARLNDSCRRSRGCVARWLNHRTMSPKEITSGAEAGK